MEACKRAYSSEDSHEVSKRPRLVDVDNDLNTFILWCSANGLNLNAKVKVQRQGSCHNYGLVAVEDIPDGECLFEIPRGTLLGPQTSGIAKLLEKESSSLCSDSGWVPLLLSLMYEYTTPTSRFQPYVTLVPDHELLDLPMVWPRSVVEAELSGTGVPEAVCRDLAGIEMEFQNIVLPFVKKHSDIFCERCTDIEFYKQMVAFVMAYSFTEPQSEPDVSSDFTGDDPVKKTPPFMVPMADILNHIAKNNAHLDFGKDALKMVAVKPIATGEEIFNTYGPLANFELLHMYGFSEAYPENHYDTVDMPHQFVQAVLKDGLDNSGLKLFTKKWSKLEERGVVSTDGSFVVGSEGIMTEDEMFCFLKVMCMSSEELDIYDENDGWSDDEVDEELEGMDTLSNEFVQKMSPSWKKMLSRMAEGCLKRYRDCLQTEEDRLLPENYKALSRREKYSLHVRYGQLKLLHNLIALCET